MKYKLIILAIIAFFHFGSILSQNCIQTYILFERQGEVDSFAINYPGCTHINGNVIIGASVDSLNGLNQINKIKGSFILINSNSLFDFEGLSNLDSIEGSFIVKFNTQLANFVGLTNLSYIGGSLEVNNNSNLDGFIGLENLDKIVGNLSISNNPNLTDFLGLTSLNSIGSLLLTSNSAITSFIGLNNLNTISGSCSFSSLGIQNFNGLNNLNEIGESLIINNNTLLDNLSGFNNLRKVGSSFSFTNNFKVTNFIGLDSLKTVNGTFSISGSRDLISFNGLQKLDSIGGSFLLSNNNKLQSFFGLNNLLNIEGKLDLTNNTLLQNFTGLNRLKRIGNLLSLKTTAISSFNGLDSISYLGGINLDNNSSLSNLIGLGDGNDIEIQGTINIKPSSQISIFSLSYVTEIVGTITGCTLNGNITGFEVFNQVDTIFGNLSISNNNSLVILNSFNNLSKVYNITISYCPYLLEIAGFINLDTILYFCNIENNSLLSNLSGFDHALEVSTWLIKNNSVLSNCSISPICKYLWKYNTLHALENNSNGCNTSSEILINCGNPPDLDDDGVNDYIDNCLTISNSDQIDCNSNGIGDVCETLDSDCDGIFDINDNCPLIPNPQQTDLNSNGIGDACEDVPKIGFNQLNPKTELHISNGSIYIDNPEKSLILKNFQGQCYIIRAKGNLVEVIYIPCPQ